MCLSQIVDFALNSKQLSEKIPKYISAAGQIDPVIYTAVNPKDGF